MEYNTSLSHLILPEYGRNVQKLVEHAKTIKDRQERTEFARSIVYILGNMNPHLRDINDFKHKLWDHLAIMSNFELDIDAPYPMPERSDLYEKPEPLPYNQNRIRYRHYGKLIEHMIDVAAEYEDGPKKEALIALIANHLKKSYLLWNNKDLASDDIILDNLREISNGRIEVNPNIRLAPTREILKNANTSSSSSSSGGKGKGKGGGGKKRQKRQKR